VNTRGDEGFSLIEVVVAGMVLSIAAAGAAAMGGVAVKLTATARLQTQCLLLAFDKLEELRTSAVPLATSGALDVDQPGFVDFVDGDGHRLAGGSRSPEAVFVRRWSIQPLTDAPSDAAVIQVRVGPVAAPSRASPGSVSGEVIVETLRARRQP
jgi:prepilin-type N-terminal cleavage/methylation domain-containing protein